MTPEGLARLRLDEGLRLVAYRDKGGVLTIGYGHTTGPVVRDGMTISRADAEVLLHDDVARAEAGLRCLPWFDGLDPVRRDVLVNIAFNVGVTGLLHWLKTLSHFQDGDFAAAADDLLNEGKWNRDVGQRAVRLSQATRAGSWAGIA